jgi:cytochrome c5
MMTIRLQRRAVCAIAGFAVSFGLFVDGSAAATSDRSGKEIVESTCISCHGEGKDGAPRPGNTEEWAPRAKGGLTKLLQSSMEGLRKMPSHGGQAALSDLEMTRAITYMVSGGRTPDPVKTFGNVAHGTGEQIVSTACANCHREGLNGAPKLGDRTAWLPRLQNGMNELVASAMHGHNQMPARGGFANLSDIDIRAAVSFMVTRAVAQKQ